MAAEDESVLTKRAQAVELLRAGRASEAQRLLADLVRQHPTDASLHHQLGDAAAWAGDPVAAIASLQTAVKLQSRLAGAWARLGNVYRQVGELDAAIRAFEQCVQLDSTPDIQSNLADALIAAARAGEAVPPLEAALRTDPSHFAARFNLACAWMRLGKVDDAIAAFEALLAVRPDSPNVHYNLAIALLRRSDFQRGDFPRGWREFEWRFRLAPSWHAGNFFAGKPMWTGEPLAGRTLLIHTEQGFGDAIQFARFAPLAAERGGRVIVACSPPLQRLMASLAGGIEIADLNALPAFDLHCPIMSLPFLLGTTIDTIPSKTPYLAPPADLVKAWTDRLRGVPNRRIGLAWSGSPSNTLNRYRSCPFEKLAPLFDVPGITFFSLQKDAGAEQLRASALASRVIDHTADLRDWADTAALMANLDLIVTIDTAIAHLAGAIGRPTWTMLSVGSDWRWHLDRSDSPWYPSMRLFRQRTLNDWGELVERVVDELAAFAKAPA